MKSPKDKKSDKQTGWKKTVDARLMLDLEKTAQAAYENGCELSKDARLLFDAHRYSRATALAILAEEEFCKAFTLKQSALNRRWDSTIYNALHNHANKQGLAEAVVNYIDWEEEEAQRLGGFRSEYPDVSKSTEIVAAAKERSHKRVKDKLKQDALYVSIFKDGKINSLPTEITKEDAESCLLFTEKFQDKVSLLFGDQDALERFFKL